MLSIVYFFFFKQKTAYEMLRSLVGSEMCIRDRFGTSLYLDGVVALSQGYLFTSIIWSAAMVLIIDREFELAGVWTMLAAVLSMIGLIHGYDRHAYDNECYAHGLKNKFGISVASDFGFAYLFASMLLLGLQWYTQGNFFHLNRGFSSAKKLLARSKQSFVGSFLQVAEVGPDESQLPNPLLKPAQPVVVEYPDLEHRH
eukprot:TRINITY_DN62842_c0_g1_i1.p1 TRINITY_DN62842_c0_g1~~TRINITY_DN62842_c0_g1_i1.p1  ORF type:complete len:199 (+),score=47.97 TRINITY_DN62842_c0_g1_i1:66-662(+)